MRGLGLLASIILLTGLAACAEPAGPNYAYAPGELYGPWPEGYSAELYGPWPEGHYCCGPGQVLVKHSHHHHHHHDHGGHGGHGGHHH